ncbi:TIGR03943 family putative permease subunit [Prauserella rugosa]|uniref:Putative repeat protein (TIGR03943 family) n=1 Tax=Prauserella rugosa TaxID=43354 RepID=A0A660CFG7_9PSEU|nr:TIGR03943 family protein [Prauserella rugosa]TWH19701.1 putative repeat protein (TIGR03943 family) [Prauserella rugosa]
MRRETQNILLLLLGGALLKIAFTGDYLRYVKGTQLPWIVAAGLVTVVLAAVAIATDVRSAARSGANDPATNDPATNDPATNDPAGTAGEPGADTGSDTEAEREHEHAHSARSAWLILAPVLAVLLVAPPALGADSVLRARQNFQPADTDFGPLPAGEVVPMTMTDFVTRAGWDETGALEGRTVRLTGFVVPTDDGPQLARMVIGCCAADAFALRTELSGGQADLLPADTWVVVTGRLVDSGDRHDRDYVPELDVRTLREIPQPDDPYET